MKAGVGEEDKLGGEFAFRLTGKQTINRAEAMAVLHALSLSRLNRNIHMYIDSQTTIDSMEKLWYGRGKMHRVYKDMANFSIFNTINQIRQQLHQEGYSLHPHKVKSHQAKYNGVSWHDITDAGDRYNARAHELAGTGTRGEVWMEEAWHNCSRAVLMVGGQLEETPSYGTVYRHMDEAVLKHARSLKRASPRLKVYDMEGVWREAVGTTLNTLR